MPIYTDLNPIQAVHAAKRDAVHDDDAWKALDRTLRRHLLRVLCDGDASEALREGLLAATDWARAERREPWVHAWPAFFELLRSGERSPSLAKGVRAIEPGSRSAEVLAFVARHAEPVRPMDVEDALGISKSNVGNILRRLEEARLTTRRKGGGRAAWVFATPRGKILAEHLSPATQNAPEKPLKAEDFGAGSGLAPEMRTWTLDEPAPNIH